MWWINRCAPTAADYPEAISCPECRTAMWAELLEAA